MLQGYTQWQNMKQMVRDRKNMFLFICTLKNQIIKRWAEVRLLKGEARILLSGVGSGKVCSSFWSERGHNWAQLGICRQRGHLFRTSELGTPTTVATLWHCFKTKELLRFASLLYSMWQLRFDTGGFKFCRFCTSKKYYCIAIPWRVVVVAKILLHAQLCITSRRGPYKCTTAICKRRITSLATNSTRGQGLIILSIVCK